MADVLNSKTHRFSTGCGNLYVTVCRNIETDKTSKIIVTLGKAGGCPSCTLAAISLMCDELLRLDCPPKTIARWLRGQSCHVPGSDCLSCVDAVGLAIERETGKENPITENDTDGKTNRL